MSGNDILSDYYDEMIDISKDVKFGIKTTVTGLRNNITDYGFVIYSDGETYSFEQVDDASDFEFSIFAYYSWNEEYIFICHARTGWALSIFDLKNRIIIKDSETMKRIQLNYLKEYKKDVDEENSNYKKLSKVLKKTDKI